MCGQIRIEMNYYTYAYLREDRTPYYIGKGKGNRAHRRSKRDIKPPKDKSRIIFLKQNLTEKEAFRHEVYMIAVLGRKDLGTGILRNKTNGGEGTLGIVVTPEFRQKMSELTKGRKHTQEAKEKVSKANKGKSPWNKGKSPPEEVKQKISQSNKNKQISPETREKLKLSSKGENNSFYGKKHTNETKRKMSQNHADVSGENNPMMGVKHSPEAKEKMRQAWLKRKEMKRKPLQ
jgi:hypothetical protein